MAKHKNRVPVYSKNSDITHFSSAAFAEVLVTDHVAYYVCEDPRAGIKLRYEETWSGIKDRYRRYAMNIIPVIFPARRPETLVLSYPIANQESDGLRKSAELWMQATNF